ncbi:hypothetical protein [Mycoplasmopsis felis]|uniref:hypothetical protein n=1 Tax=Mycoplasmopsis felis TaxID=33923 RepID=UPI002AFE6F12|nr:hypothetical protein [Mycoplasmopsis felis]WQQ07659.1 hypothetical protein RRG57_03430 [Mycoplasmopsis felis]
MYETLSVALFAILIIISIKFIKDAFLVRKFYLKNIIYKTTKKWMLINSLILSFLLIPPFVLLILIGTKSISIYDFNNVDILEKTDNIFLLYHFWIYLSLVVFLVPVILFNYYFWYISKINSYLTTNEIQDFNLDRINDFDVENSYIVVKHKRKKDYEEQHIRFKDYISSTLLWRKISIKLYYKSIVKKCLYFYLRSPQKLETKRNQFNNSNEALLVLVHSAIRFLNTTSIQKIKTPELWNTCLNLVIKSG